MPPLVLNFFQRKGGPPATVQGAGSEFFQRPGVCWTQKIVRGNLTVGEQTYAMKIWIGFVKALATLAALTWLSYFGLFLHRSFGLNIRGPNLVKQTVLPGSQCERFRSPVPL